MANLQALSTRYILPYVADNIKNQSQFLYNYNIKFYTRWYQRVWDKIRVFFGKKALRFDITMVGVPVQQNRRALFFHIFITRRSEFEVRASFAFSSKLSSTEGFVDMIHKTAKNITEQLAKELEIRLKEVEKL